MTSGKKIGELDGFRAIAILLVVNFHYGIHTRWLPTYRNVVDAGWFGVSLFFVLSGFLLSMPFIEAALATGDVPPPNAKRYFRNRIVRIFPMYYLTLFVFMAIYFSMGDFIRMHNVSFRQFLAHVFFLQNWRGDHSHINAPYWSVAADVQFYLLMPILGLFVYRCLKRGNKNRLVLGLLPLAVLPMVYRFYLQMTGNDDNWDVHVFRMYASTFANLDAFAFGIYAAVDYYITKRDETRVGKKRWVIAAVLASVALFILMQTGSATHKSPPVNFQLPTAIHLCWAILIVSTLALTTSPWNRFLASKPLRYISRISYSLYLWHLMVFNICSALAVRTGIGLGTGLTVLNLTVALGVTFGLSTLTYYAIERPLLRWNRSGVSVIDLP